MTFGTSFVRAALGAMLLAAGAAKLADMSAFKQTLSSLAGETLGRTAGALAGSEVALGSLLLLQIATPVLDFLVALLTGAFLVFIVKVTRTHAAVTCRCFGALSNASVGARAILRNSALLASALVLIAVDAGNSSVLVPAVWRVLTGAAAALFALACAQASHSLALVELGSEG